MFNSAGMGWGGISSLASYNNFHNNVERWAYINVYSAGMGWGGISTLASYNNFHNNVER